MNKGTSKSTSREAARGKIGVRLTIPILGLLGIGISSYLVYVHYYELTTVCLPGFECAAVLTSSYAIMWGIPISLLGLCIYSILTLLGIWLLFNRSEKQDLLSLTIYTITLSGGFFTIYLYYLEVFVLHGFCTWCIGSSIVIFGLLILSLINLFTSQRYISDIPRYIRIKVRRYVQW
ncbi:hypothetical protein ES703_113537 [subsurface metagenome]